MGKNRQRKGIQLEANSNLKWKFETLDNSDTCKDSISLSIIISNNPICKGI